MMKTQDKITARATCRILYQIINAHKLRIILDHSTLWTSEGDISPASRILETAYLLPPSSTEGAPSTAIACLETVIKMELEKKCIDCLHYYEYFKQCYRHGDNKYKTEPACEDFYQISDKAKHGETGYAI